MSNFGPQITNVDNRPWYKKPIGIAGIVGGIVVVGGIAAASGGGGDDSSAPPASPTTSAHAGGKSSAAAPETSAPAEPAATWKTVAKLRGDTNGSGADFHLNGCETRMRYRVKGDSSALVAFYVMKSGTKLLEDGGFPVASPTKSGPGETEIHEDAGDYYLDVMAANASWSVKLEEKC